MAERAAGPAWRLSPEKILGRTDTGPIVLANPLRLKLSQSGTKTDKLDAWQLANRLRMDDVPTLVAGHYDPVLSAYHEGARKRRPPVVAQSHLAKKMAIYIWHMLKKRQPCRFVDQKAYQAKLVRLARLASRV